MKKRAGSIGFILVFSVVLIVLGNTTDFSEPCDTEAYYAAQSIIEKAMKISGTTRFPFLGEEEVKVDNISKNEWKIKGYIECKSSDDIVQQYQFNCRIIFEPDDGRWKLLNIELGQ